MEFTPEKYAEENYYFNVMRMSINWTTVSFTTYLLHYQLKFLQGSIFKNNNYSAISDAFAIIAGGQLFYRVGIKRAYIISFSCGIIGGLGILYLEEINKTMREKDLTHE